MQKYFKNIDKRSEKLPAEKTWLKLARKLDRYSYRQRLNTYKNIAIAAIALFVICFAVLISSYFNDLRPESLNRTVQAIHYEIEDLETSSDMHYAYNNIKILSAHYEQLAGLTKD